MKKKLALSLLILVTVLGSLVGCGNKNETDVKSYSLEGVKAKGKIVMGTSADFPPNEFHIMVDGKDTIVGYDIEIGKYIANKLGVEFELKEMEFDKLLAGLDTGMLDMVISGMVPKPDREANFTKSYDVDGTHSIMIRKTDAAKYKSEADFSGATLGAQSASLQKELADGIEGANVRELPLINTLIMELKTNKIDGLVIPNETGHSYTIANDDLMIIEEIVLKYDKGGACVALKTGNDELTEYINEVIDELIEQGLVQKWKEEAKALSDQEIK